MKETILHSITKRSLHKKLLFLLTTVAIGFILVIIIGYININSMKKNLDKLYFGSLIPVIELNEIIHAYHDVESSITQSKNNLISIDKTQDNLLSSQNIIIEKWRNYTSHYKGKNEISYINFSSKEIKKSLHFLSKIIEVSNAANSTETISMKKVHNHIQQMKTTLGKLIAYEIDVAHLERQNLLSTYKDTLLKIAIVLLIVILIIAIIILGIFKSIQSQQESLNIASKKLKEANKQLEEASYTDELTTLYNRRFFNLIYERELKKAKRSKTAICFMMIDIDFFKLYNDTYGHLEGDNVLHEVALTLKSTLNRPGDYIFRLGGEEFGVLITSTNADTAKRISQKLCDKVVALEIEHEHNQASNYVSISVGAITLTPSVDLEPQYLLSTADENLYRAKDDGRNQAVCSNVL